MISIDYRYRADSDLVRKDRIAHVISEIAAWLVLGLYTLGVLLVVGGAR